MISYLLYAWAPREKKGSSGSIVGNPWDHQPVSRSWVHDLQLSDTPFEGKHRENGRGPQGSLLFVPLRFKKIFLGILERMGSIPNLRVEDQ